MKEQFADYETAKMLKELGFDEPCIGAYHNQKFQHSTREDAFDSSSAWRTFGNHNTNSVWCTAPLWQQVKQWLWEEYKIGIGIQYGTKKGENQTLFYYVIAHHNVKNALDGKLNKIYFDSPITAEIEGIKRTVHHLHSQLTTKKHEEENTGRD